MSTPADLSRPLPTAATEAREEKLVESKGFEPLADSTPRPGAAAQSGAAEVAPSAPAPAELIASPPSLLEAAKRVLDLYGLCGSEELGQLRAAIAREESRSPSAEELALVEVAKARWHFSIPDGQTVVQAMWALRKGKERAEAELEKVRREILHPALSLLGAERNQGLVEAVKRTLQGISSINGIHLAAGARPGIDDVTAKVLELRQRAEKAEAELAAVKAEPAKRHAQPVTVQQVMDQRNAEIVRLVANGVGPSEVARQFNLDPSRVSQIVAKQRAQAQGAV